MINLTSTNSNTKGYLDETEIKLILTALRRESQACLEVIEILTDCDSEVKRIKKIAGIRRQLEKLIKG